MVRDKQNRCSSTVAPLPEGEAAGRRLLLGESAASRVAEFVLSDGSDTGTCESGMNGPGKSESGTSDSGTPDPGTPDPAMATALRLANYELIACIGTGASSTVYAAFRVGTDRLVAVKVLESSRPAEEISQLATRELDHLCRLRLASVPRLLDYGQAGDRMFLVTEYIEGRPLDVHCRASQLDLRQIMQLLCEVLEAVHAVHAYGLIHRDLKPSNILIDQDGRPAIIDFGIALAAPVQGVDGAEREELVSPVAPAVAPAVTSPLGSLAFMSPEQAQSRAEPLSIRCDIFSLAATAVYLLCGKSVHGELPDRDAWIRAIRTRGPQPVRALDPSIPVPVAAILDTALAFDPEDRFASAHDFRCAVQQWLDGRPVELANPSRLTRARLFVRRNPLLSILGVCSALATAGLILLAMYAFAQASLAEEYADLAVEQRDVAEQREALLKEHREATRRMTLQSRRLREIVENYIDKAERAADGGRLGESLAIVRALDALFVPGEELQDEVVAQHGRARAEILQRAIHELYQLDSDDHPELHRRVRRIIVDLESRRADGGE